ncbi:hypothetical protein FOA52_008975 [Chlamydomonas sp. UWO 241]|nr:hypothetical protein FOA52_008975 [Chlamydomonas sp. UWO 241]
METPYGVETQLREACLRLAGLASSRASAPHSDSGDAVGDDAAELSALAEVLCLQSTVKRLLESGAGQGEIERRSNASNRDEALRGLRLAIDGVAQGLADDVDRTQAILDAGEVPDPGRPSPSPEAILELGHRLRYTTFAHAGLVSQPPCPQQAQMLNSSLFVFSQARAADAMPAALTAHAAPHAAPHAAAHAGPTLQPPTAAAAAPKPAPKPDPGALAAMLPTGVDLSALPPMPADWAPGDPMPGFPPGFQLPPNIPEMPAGWKPGDPLPFASPPAAAAARQGGEEAGADAAAAVAAATEQEAAMERAAAPAAGPKPPVVREDLLTFILNPDLEEADDYSDSSDGGDD